MVAGRIATETTSAALVSDPDAQRRFLGVEPLAESA
jgi:branched-chain amino acid transport system ATP-binding protein